LEYMADSDPPLYHRDVKPANIIVHPERGSVLIDFGLSKGVSAGQDVSMSRGASEGWSPPERRDGVSGPFTDVYSLGQIMWHLLTGKRPFHVIGEDEESIITNLGHPAWVVDLMRMCSLPYKKRIQTVVEFRMRIENEGRL
ncbi:MAG: protein kinase, partial [Candidatus Thalassarchaeaceae archaeon]|nr:protein kinase [Candidatus Thalassarchaeaceae archaeon]